MCDIIELNGKKYKAVKEREEEYVIVRTYSAGVFSGYLEKRDGKQGTIRNARRFWYWSGAASLSELAVDGVKNPNECKFPCEVDKIELTEIVEILYCTDKAKESIANVKVWTANE